MRDGISVKFGSKAVALTLTPAANAALQQRQQPLYAEMELYFSCMIRKKVRFYEQASGVEYQMAANNLRLGFRPVMTQQCSIHETDGPPPVTDFPIVKAENFIPHWVRIDFVNGKWCGEFGFN